MKEVTDPTILGQLESKEVTDPAILAQLEGKLPVSNPPPETFLGNLRRKAEIAMGGVNVGAANLAGMPVDIVNKIQSIFLPTSEEPVGGSEWIKKKLMTPPPEPVGLVEKTIGATAEQIPAGLAAIFSGGSVPMAARLVSGAGVGSGVARTVAPDNPLVDFGAQVVGGLGGVKFPNLIQSLKQARSRTTIADLAEKVGGKMKPSLAGKSAQEWMEIGSQEAKDVGDQLYTITKDEAKNISINKYPNTWETIDKIKSSRDYKMLKLEDRNHIDGIIDQVKGETSTPVKAGRPRQFTPEQQADLERQVVEQYGIPAPPETSFDSAIGLKRTLGQQSWEAKGTSKGRIIRDLKDSVLKDMEQAAADAGQPQIIDNLANADKFWSEQVFGEGRGATIKRFQNLSPEKLVDKLKTGTLKDITAIKDMSGTEGFQSLRQGFVTDLAQRNENNAVRISRETRRLMANRSEEMGKIFDPEELTILQNMTNPGIIKTFMEGHPNTAWLLKWLFAYGIIGGTAYHIIRKPLTEFGIGR